MKERVLIKVNQYLEYLQGVSHLDIVNANVHLILSTERGKLTPSQCWQEFTNKTSKTYQGFGKHIEMFGAEPLEKNVEIIKKILEGIECEIR